MGGTIGSSLGWDMARGDAQSVDKTIRGIARAEALAGRGTEGKKGPRAQQWILKIEGAVCASDITSGWRAIGY